MKQKTYKFKVWRDGEYYLAKLYIGNKVVGLTEGKDKKDLFEMVADAFMCVEDVKVSWWERMKHRFDI